jgi:quinohemoprotein ethanol dehydrogenase
MLLIRSAALAAAATCVMLVGAAPAASARDVDAKRILQANDATADWLTHGRTYDERRYTPLARICM